VDLRWDRPSKPGSLQLSGSLFAPRPPREGGLRGRGMDMLPKPETLNPGLVTPGRRGERRGEVHGDTLTVDSGIPLLEDDAQRVSVGVWEVHGDTLTLDSGIPLPPKTMCRATARIPRSGYAQRVGVLLQRYFLTASESDLPSLSISVGRGREDYCVFLSNGERTVRTERCFALACRESKVEDGPC